MTDTYRIEIPERFGCAPGAHVTIRGRQSWARRQRVQTAGMRITPQEDGSNRAQGNIDALGKGLAVLESSVLTWEGVLDEGGRPLPPAREGFMSDDFDPDLGDWLVDEIEAYYDRAADGAPGKPRLVESTSSVAS